MKALTITVKGIVQGVGFRPFLLRTAKRLSLTGTAANTPSGVRVTACGSEESLAEFVDTIRNSPPPMARIESVETAETAVFGADAFVIMPSEGGAADTFVSPDIAVCDNCIRDIENSADRRYNYAFTNCTDCGPRFSIIEGVPYDRCKTVMKHFEMCAECEREYTDPPDRRFHAQPVACPDCGPRLKFLLPGGEADDPVEAFVSGIKSGKIIAVKGIGGYHLACDALNENAVSLLRRRKGRRCKAFAVMARNIETAEKYCCIDETEKKLLTGAEKPIVILKRRPGAEVSPSVSPDGKTLGVMLPYTPLHYLLMKSFELLVMTSGNQSDLPMLFGDGAARLLLDGLADGVLDHNRKIVRRVDDSVCRVINGEARFLRRARGFAPEPVRLPDDAGVNMLALGAQQKNTFCLVKGQNAFVSSHIGDLDDEETALSYENEIDRFLSLFDAAPGVTVCDAHPDYYSSRTARRFNGRLLKIQHHRAHFAAALAENAFEGEALGLIFDGTGLGDDGSIWGGEALFGTIADSRRVGSLKTFLLPGNDAAVKEPWRTAASLINGACPEKGFGVLGEKAALCTNVIKAAESGINTSLTSSMGRLFDGIAAIAGLCLAGDYEGQGAELLENCADGTLEGSYHFEISEENGSFVFDWRPVVKSAVDDRLGGAPASLIAVKFHRAAVKLICDFAVIFAEKTGAENIALSGGCFQNEFLSSRAETELSRLGFRVLVNRLVPCNDGGISFGQAAAAAAIINNRK